MIKTIARSRVAPVLVVAHLTLAVYGLATKPAFTSDFWQHFNESAHTIPIAGRAVRIPDEAPLLKTICWLDLPSLSILYIVSFVLIILPDISIQTLSWVAAVLLFAITFVQWWLIGFFLDRAIASIWKKRGGSKAPSNKSLDRSGGSVFCIIKDAAQVE